MPVLSVRVSDDLAVRFDGAAEVSGGRSAALHRLVEGFALPTLPVAPPAREPRTALRLMVRLAYPEARHVELQAPALGLPCAGWVAALVRNHACGAPRLPRADGLDLLAIHGEVRRIGVNVNQIARALNSAVMEGQVLDTELGAIGDLQRELRSHIAGLGEAFAGNLNYWATDL